MRKLDVIEEDIRRTQKAIREAEGAQTEVYSRIVGYYRSVRNWNKGKREEYGERRLYDAEKSMADNSPMYAAKTQTGASMLLFVREACPACPSAKQAAARLGIKVDMIDADTDDGLNAARRYHVMSTPTAILFSADGGEIGRARDAAAITAFAM